MKIILFFVVGLFTALSFSQVLATTLHCPKSFTCGAGGSCNIPNIDKWQVVVPSVTARTTFNLRQIVITPNDSARCIYRDENAVVRTQIHLQLLINREATLRKGSWHCNKKSHSFCGCETNACPLVVR